MENNKKRVVSGKRYKDKLKECKEAGNIAMDGCIWCNRSILICKKNHMQCTSKNCREK